jgi:hypothetical protein
MKKIILVVGWAMTGLLYAQAQNMGVKLNSGTLPNTTLDVNGAVSFREGTALTVGNGVNSNLTLGTYTLYRVVGATTAFSITGFTGGVDGRILTLINTTTQIMSLPHQTTSTTTNQINTGGLTLQIAANGAVNLVYNTTLSKWVVLSANGAAGVSSDWSLTGNSGTTAGTNFVGTTDAQDLVLKANNTEGVRIANSTRNVGIGTATPSNTLHVNAGSNPVRLQGLQTGASSDMMLTADATGVVRQASYPQYVDITELTGTVAITAGSLSVTANAASIGSVTATAYESTFTLLRASLVVVDACMSFESIRTASGTNITDGTPRIFRSYWKFSTSNTRYGTASTTYTNSISDVQTLGGTVTNNNGFNIVLPAGTYTLQYIVVAHCSSSRSVLCNYGANLNDRVSIKAIQLQ